MTIDNAKIAAAILNDIERLEQLKAKLQSASSMNGYICKDGIDSFKTPFVWDKGTTNGGKFIVYIIDGISKEISDLKLKLSKM